MKNKLISVRIGDKTASELAAIARATDRSISQLCRYALAYLNLNSHELTDFIANEEKESLSEEAAGFRLTLEDSERVSQLASQLETTNSEIIRASLRFWLDNTKPHSDLGAPPQKQRFGSSDD
jgi:predicted transcriptional regulator